MFDDLQLLTMNDVRSITKMGKTTIYSAIAKNKFPQPIKVNRLSRWREKDIKEWQRQQCAEKWEDQPETRPRDDSQQKQWPDDPMFS